MKPPPTNPAQAKLLNEREQTVSRQVVIYPKHDAKGKFIGTFSFTIERVKVNA